jgi:hypothetical protein
MAVQLTWFRLKPSRPDPNASKVTDARRQRLTELVARLSRSEAPLIILPYTAPQGRLNFVRWTRKLIPPLFLFFCLFWGAAFAFFAPSFLPFFAVPVVILATLTIWALPDTRQAPTRTMAVVFWVFMLGLELWPNYLALALPGLPWITMIRLSGIPLSLLLLICVSVSKSFRQETANSLRAAPMLSGLLIAFSVLQLVSVAISKKPFFSLDRFVVDISSWTAIFFVSAYLFRTPGRIERWAYVIWAMTFVLCLEGTAEWRLGHTVWAGHIPGFLKMADDGVADQLARGSVRTGSNAYRVQATSSTALGFGEYLALAMPFVLHFAIAPGYRLLVKIMAVATLPLLLFVLNITDARSGMLGALIALFLSPFLMTMIARRNNPKSMMASAIVIGSPMIMAAAIGGSLFFHRVREKIFGGGAQQSSTDARVVQYHDGLAKIWSHPWGYGIGMGGETLQYYSPAGLLTIDTYYLTIALEYGVVGFLIYYTMIIIGGARAAQLALHSTIANRDYLFLVPISIALLEFFIIKSVFSQQDNHPLIYMMLGAVAAVTARINQDKRAALMKNVPQHQLAGPSRPPPKEMLRT